jgi:hypothetical protein
MTLSSNFKNILLWPSFPLSHSTKWMHDLLLESFAGFLPVFASGLQLCYMAISYFSLPRLALWVMGLFGPANHAFKFTAYSCFQYWPEVLDTGTAKPQWVKINEHITSIKNLSKYQINQHKFCECFRPKFLFHDTETCFEVTKT